MKRVMKSKNRPIIAGIGELLWDMFPTGKKAGGAPVNFAYHASVSGAESYAISAVGNDDLGKEIIDYTRYRDRSSLRGGLSDRYSKSGIEQGTPTISLPKSGMIISFTPSIKEIARKAVLFVLVRWRSAALPQDRLSASSSLVPRVV